MKKIILSLALMGSALTYSGQTWNTTLNAGAALKLGTSSNNSLDFYTYNHLAMSLATDGSIKIGALGTGASGLLMVDPNGTIIRGPAPGQINSPCLSSALPWYNGGNRNPMDNTIGTCSATNFLLKSNSQIALILTPAAYTGIGLNNLYPNAALDISDGTIASNTSHMKIFGDQTGRIESTGDMTLVSNNNMWLSSTANVNISPTANLNLNSANLISNTNSSNMSSKYGMDFHFNVNGSGSIFNIFSGTAAKLSIASNGNTTVNGHIGVNAAPTTAEGIFVADPAQAIIRAHTPSNGSAKFSASNGYGTYDFTIDNNGSNNFIGSIASGNLNFISYKAYGYPQALAQVWIGARPTTGAHTDFMFAVNGKMVAKSIYVTIAGAWADYVFEKNYALPKLADVEAYYKENKHLPEIPSASQVEDEGIDLAEINKLLLKKVEELTIYLVEQQKEISAQQKEIAAIKKSIQK